MTQADNCVAFGPALITGAAAEMQTIFHIQAVDTENEYRQSGGAYVAMNSASLGATKVFAWPDAEVAVMGAVAAIRILHRKRLAEVPPESREQVELELAAEHEVISGGIKRAVEMGVVHDIVDPVATKRAVAQVLWDTPGVRGQHGNIPL